jgi:myo-inositol-1-phosphate synthase
MSSSSAFVTSSFRVDSTTTVYTDDSITSEYTYKTTRFDAQSNRVSLHQEELVFKTNTIVPKTGLMLVGWGGNNGTTLTAGCIANKLGLNWMTKEGEVKSNFYGSMTQSSTIRIAQNAQGQSVFIPFKNILPMVDPTDLVIGGWDISSMNLGDAMTRAQVLDYDLQRKLYDTMKTLHPLPGIYKKDFIASNQADRADNILHGSAQENCNTIRKNIRDFKAKNGLDKVIVLWTATTERFSDVISGVHDSAASLLRAIEVCLYYFRCI